MKTHYKILTTMAAATFLWSCDWLNIDVHKGVILDKSYTIRQAGPVYDLYDYKQGEFAIDVDGDNHADCELVLPWPPDTTLFKYAEIGHTVTYQNRDNAGRLLVSSGNPLVRNSIFTINGRTVDEIKKMYSKQR